MSNAASSSKPVPRLPLYIKKKTCPLLAKVQSTMCGQLLDVISSRAASTVTAQLDGLILFRCRQKKSTTSQFNRSASSFLVLRKRTATLCDYFEGKIRLRWQLILQGFHQTQSRGGPIKEKRSGRRCGCWTDPTNGRSRLMTISLPWEKPVSFNQRI